MFASGPVEKGELEGHKSDNDRHRELLRKMFGSK